jgi:hypothetical protein
MFAMKPTLAALLLVAYATVLITHLSWAAGGADSSGYLNEARLMASGRTSLPIEPLKTLHLTPDWAYAFVPLGFTERGPRMVPVYPPGLPAQFAIAGAVGGWARGPFLVPPIAALVCLVLMFVLGRQLGLQTWRSFAGAALLGVCPVFLFMAAQPMSDVIATAWTLAAMVCALANVPIAAGAAFAISVCVRPSNALMTIPLAVALRFKIRPLMLAAIGALPLAIAVMIWNHALFGSAVTTGYGSVREMVAWQNVRERLPDYSYWLAVQLPLVFPLGLLTRRALLWAWFLPFFVFYCFYSVGDAWWYTRFLLPAFPPLIIGFLLLIDRVPRAPAMAILVAIVAIGIAQSVRLRPLNVGEAESIYPETVRWAERQLPRNAVVFSMQCSGAFLYYSGRQTIRWDLLDNDRFQHLRGSIGIANLKPYAVLFPEEWEQIRGHLAANWTPIGQRRGVRLVRVD